MRLVGGFGLDVFELARQEAHARFGYGLAIDRSDLNVARPVIAASSSARFDPGFVLGLLGPLILDPTIDFVKAAFARPLRGARPCSPARAAGRWSSGR